MILIAHNTKISAFFLAGQCKVDLIIRSDLPDNFALEDLES